MLLYYLYYYCVYCFAVVCRWEDRKVVGMCEVIVVVVVFAAVVYAAAFLLILVDVATLDFIL